MRVRNFMRVSILVVSLICASSAECAVRAWVDGNTVSSSGTIELNLEHDGQISADPDLSPLERDFDVLGSSRSTSMQIVNGNATSSVRLALSLSPKRSGSMAIPALTWGNEKSDPIVINSGASSASAGNADAGAGGALVYLKTSIQPQRSYVQAGVDLTVRVYAAVPLSQGDLDLPANNDVVVQQVGADRTETVVENGRRYQVVERHYELFPQRSGSLKLPGPVLNARVVVQDRNDLVGNAFKDLLGNFPMNAFTSMKPIRVRADDISLDVLPRPAGATGAYWLPARHLTLEARWHPADGRPADGRPADGRADQGQPKAGDPVTLDLHLEAQGLTAAQLPDLSAVLKLPEGIKAYPDQPNLKNDANGTSLTGIRDQSVALIADRAGEFIVPALSVHWWDTNANVEREAIVPARTLTFAPGVPQAVTSQPAAAPAQTASPDGTGQAARSPRGAASGSPDAASAPAQQRWFWSSVGLGILWVATLVAWYLKGRARVPPAPVAEAKPAESASEARRQFRDACKRNDARAARASLREWLKSSAPGRASINLRALARNSADENLERLLRELDRACFAGSPWTGEKLLEALQELPAKRGKPKGQDDRLMPLYK